MKNICETYRLMPQDRTLLVMPLFHVHGLLAAFLSPLHSGGCVIVPQRFSATEFWSDFTTHKANWYTAVPTIHQILLKTPLPKPIPNIRFIRSCSSPLSPSTFHRLEETFNAPVLEAYAMTEAAHQLTSNPLPPSKRKPGSVGVGQGVEIKILDSNAEEVAQGFEGEICIRGENVTKGYLNNPEANKSSFTRSGFFRTGDQGKKDEDGYVIITGRIKELINKGGEKISPIELDNIVAQHPAVGEVVSFAMADEMYGQEVGIAIVLRQGKPLGEGELREWMAERVAKFKLPKKIYFTDSMPKTATASRLVMPAPGEQHRDGPKTANPFEEAKPRISEYTAKEIATLQSRLEKQLGPEYISSRPGPAGQKVHYLAGEKCINLANEVFGFNGWSSAIQNVQIDFVDENQSSGKVSLGLSVIVRVTLRDGTFHEDIGYGHIENCGKGKAAAFEKAKKEGTTDALKRALRNFGNVLGNCFYDKDYLGRVLKVKVAPPRWDVENLHRHASYVPIKKESDIKKGPEVGRSGTLGPSDDLDDEFGGSEFDEVDFSETHGAEDVNPDEVVLPVAATSERLERQKGADMQYHQALNGRNDPSKAVQAANQSANGTNATGQQYSGQGPQQNPRPNPQPVAQQGFQQGPQQSRPMMPRQPQTPGRSPQRASNAGVQQRVQGNPVPPQRLQNAPSHFNNNHPNQPNSNAAQAPVQHQRAQQPSNLAHCETPPTAVPQGHNPPAAFFTARAAEIVQVSNAIAPSDAPTFNPYAESPSIRKTSGIDHTKSKPVPRQSLSSQNPAPGVPPMARINLANPQLDATRRIGMPGNPSPILNRNSYSYSYKPPGPATTKRPADGSGTGQQRTPLAEAPTRQLSVGAEGAGDPKRAKLHN
ncbi:hypothetical protein FGG08_001874 [Glutinoglossum americanum]|uniref:RAD52 homolog n=1 Tax=Glutinoglossum americanum TaxID=1670608 RepID=A0A9P8I181_9PEZI|nr:hypothetical protein FGG08_001874 [Glutinoglossum americanum]